MHDSSNPTQLPEEKYLEKIMADFSKVAEKLQQSSQVIRTKGGYAFPMFVLSFAPVPIALGSLLIAAGELKNQAYYYATYLDVLVAAKLIAAEKVADFQATYKDPDAYASLLVLDPGEGVAKVMSIPYLVNKQSTYN